METREPEGMTPARDEDAPRSWLDEQGRVRNVIALIIVTSYVFGLIAVGLIVPSMTDAQGTMMDNVQKFSSIFSGLVGMVIGYYFGKS